MSFPFYQQEDFKDCGATCLKIIAKHFDRTLHIEKLRTLTETTREGSSLYGIAEAAEKVGFRTLAIKSDLLSLNKSPLPCVLHWNTEHFVVLYKAKKGKYFLSDPAYGLIEYDEAEFLKSWIGNNANARTQEGIALLVEPIPEFETEAYEDESEGAFNLSFLSQYLWKYKAFLIQLVLGLIAASIFQLVLPFLTQSVVDVGIQTQNLHFIYLVLFAQLSLFIGRTGIEIIRSWILLHLSTRINISLLSDFFVKLMNLPIAFFDQRMTGDILQRINDHARIEKILTTSSLSVLFSTINLIVFSIVLAYYNLKIFGIFLAGSLLFFVWIAIFLKKRKDLDFKKFSRVSQEQSKVIELINGMQEIKLHNAEREKRWSWEYLQVKLFKLSIEGLALEQYQAVGSQFINELKNILITILSAKLVIDGEITLGMMLAITYIVGQLNSPIAQLIEFVREVQDAKISLSRLAEIHNKTDENQTDLDKLVALPKDKSLQVQGLSYRYRGTDKMVLDNLNLTIPANKITAIVGVSGGGKTTLMKLLLKFYNPTEGTIKIGKNQLENLAQKTWREACGVVMQEGYIFNDTIANNIAIGSGRIDKAKLAHAVDVANIKDFIEELPLTYNTKIGMEGIGLSTGQKQRILIARAVYKDPSYLFFDEATSALDANNEKDIMRKLHAFFEDKTVVIIAHRLSTVKHADQIVVMDQGAVVEQGTHEDLVQLGGKYFNLVKNQLELGK